MRAGFVLGELWTGLRRNMSMAISVTLVTMVSLFFVGLGVLSQRQVDTMKDYWYDRVQVSIFLCTATSDQPNCANGKVTDAQRADIKSQLEAMKPLVQNVYFESQQQAYERLREQFKDSSIYRDVKPEQLPESFRVQLADPTRYEVVTSSFTGAPGVGQVQDQRRILDPLFNVLGMLMWGALGLAGLMAVCSVLLVATTIRQTAFSRRRETGIMRLVGASAAVIHLPFILETVLATLLGAALAVGALWALVHFVVTGYVAPRIPTSFVDTSDVLAMTPWLVLVGGSLAVLTSWLTLRRYLRV
ncbi:MAG TPA: permease-like cell division protein FtsX [Dermatophilaceae bacterium]|nr:permease-like cell division protein FtsX [Dermatophilaceae bacterium]